MAFTPLSTDLDIIQKLDDEPNDVGGLSAAELKAEFDKAANLIKTYINTVLLAELGSQDASQWLGVYPLDDVPTALTIHDALLGIIDIAKQAQAGTLTPNSIETAMIQSSAVTEGKVASGAIVTAKLADGAVTTAKLAGSAVTTAKIADDAVTADKIADSSVGTSHLADASVTGAKLADLGISNAKLGTGCVTSSKIGDSEVKTANINDGAVSSAKISEGAVTDTKIANNAVSTLYTATISTTWIGSGAPYAQDISIPGLLATDNPIIDIVPDSDSYATAQDQLDAWAEVFKIVTGDNVLTVLAHSATTTAIPIQILCVRK